MCAAFVAVSLPGARAQNPPTPRVKKSVRVDGIAVPEKPQKLEGVQKTISGRVEVTGSKIYYEECGAGPSAVVLLHDEWLHSVEWDEIWKPLCVRNITSCGLTAADTGDRKQRRPSSRRPKMS